MASVESTQKSRFVQYIQLDLFSHVYSVMYVCINENDSLKYLTDFSQNLVSSMAKAFV